MILMVKDAPQEIGPFTKEVAATANETLAKLDQMQSHDPALSWEKNPLPPTERDVRDSIKSDKQHQLLFEAKGPEFVRVLLVSQIEASTYGANLAKVLADKEHNAVRAQTLRGLSAKWLRIREKSYDLLRHY